MANPTTFHGVWWVPEEHPFLEKRFSGTLTYFGDKNSILELIHEPKSGAIRIDHSYDVLWGEDAEGGVYSLFGVTARNMSFTKFEFVIRFILIGTHVKSLDDACFDTCLVKYPYLNHWALDNRIHGGASQNQTLISLDLGARPPFFSTEIVEGLRVMLWGQLTDNINRFSIRADQVTNLNIDTVQNTSLNTFLKTISEFSQFLSIALFAEQHPSEITFANKGVRFNYPLLFKKNPSTEPFVKSLIKYDELQQRLGDILDRWHKNYDRSYLISHYLIRSLSERKDVFDVPDFLTIAQAVDGYYKRFVNHKDGKDTHQYKQQLDILLKRFKGVDVIQQCNINSEVLTQTRDKYSHLIPDEDAKINQAVEDGEPLYWLTQKCIVLLTCCILDMLGLTTDEINRCCNGSPVEQITNSIPTWF